MTAEDVQDAATRRIDPTRMAIVLVGDADAFHDEIEAAGFGPVYVEREDGPVEEGRERPAAASVQPVDAGQEGPTEGAESPDEPAGDGADAEEIAAPTAHGGATDAS